MADFAGTFRLLCLHLDPANIAHRYTHMQAELGRSMETETCINFSYSFNFPSFTGENKGFFANGTAVTHREKEDIILIFIIAYNEAISVAHVSTDCW